VNPDIKLTFDVAQIFLLGGLIWGLARMKSSVDMLGDVTRTLTRRLEDINNALATLTGRVLVLEDREKR